MIEGERRVMPWYLSVRHAMRNAVIASSALFTSGSAASDGIIACASGIQVMDVM